MPTVRYFAAARDAAGLASETLPAATVRDLVDEIARRHGEPLSSLLPHCSVLVGETFVGPGGDLAVPADGTVDLLPPFAGG